jgi:undecaprenyl-diphosphatase
MNELTYLQAIVIGLLQGVTELFPISSLGHSVLVPAWLGRSWTHLVTESATGSSEQSPYLAFIVALHVATGAHCRSRRCARAECPCCSSGARSA